MAPKRRRCGSIKAGLGPHRLVFIDETCLKTNMAPLQGWGPKGARLLGRAPYGKWCTLTFLAVLRASGLSAPCVFHGPINVEAFWAWAAQILVETLSPDDIVVLDNLGSHKGVGTKRLIRSAGARLWFLPPYSPDLNPIEQTFSKIK